MVKMNEYHIYEKGEEIRRFIKALNLEIRDDGAVVFYDNSRPQKIVGISTNHDFIILLED